MSQSYLDKELQNYCQMRTNLSLPFNEVTLENVLEIIAGDIPAVLREKTASKFVEKLKTVNRADPEAMANAIGAGAIMLYAAGVKLDERIFEIGDSEYDVLYDALTRRYAAAIVKSNPVAPAHVVTQAVRNLLFDQLRNVTDPQYIACRFLSSFMTAEGGLTPAGVTYSRTLTNPYEMQPATPQRSEPPSEMMTGRATLH